MYYEYYEYYKLCTPPLIFVLGGLGLLLLIKDKIMRYLETTFNAKICIKA